MDANADKREYFGFSSPEKRLQKNTGEGKKGNKNMSNKVVDGCNSISFFITEAEGRPFINRLLS